jgi:hypothetical protein
MCITCPHACMRATRMYVTCITIIDTIILYIHTKYILTTPINMIHIHIPVCMRVCAPHVCERQRAGVCIEYIGVVSVVIEYNCVYYCDTYTYMSGRELAFVCRIEYIGVVRCRCSYRVYGV